jgi:hypothetical protein
MVISMVTACCGGPGSRGRVVSNFQIADARKFSVSGKKRHLGVVRNFLCELVVQGHSCHSFQVIACIEYQQVIDKILSNLEKKGELPSTLDTLPDTKASPPANLILLKTFGIFMICDVATNRWCRVPLWASGDF